MVGTPVVVIMLVVVIMPVVVIMAVVVIIPVVAPVVDPTVVGPEVVDPKVVVCVVPDAGASGFWEIEMANADVAKVEKRRHISESIWY